MRRQRNNLACLSFELRQRASQLLFEGAQYAAVQRALAEAGATCKLHSSTLGAWQKSAEYKEYCEARKGFDARSKANRLAALVMNDGKGPQSLADVAEYEILVQLTQLASGGLLETGKDVATVANAIAALQRTQLARAEAGRSQELDRAKEQHAAELAAKDAQIAALQAEMKRIQEEAQAKMAQLTAGRQITPEVIAQIKKLYGIKPEAPKPA